MNLYDGILFAVLVFFMILGFLRGLLKEVAALLLIVLPMVSAIFLSPFLADFLQKNTKINSAIEQVLQDKIKLATDEKSSDKLSDEKALKEEETKEDGTKDIDKTKNTPKSIEELSGYLSVFSKDPKKEISSLAVKEISGKIIRALAFIIIYFVLYLGISILCFTLNIIAKIPVLSGFNRFFGAILGLGKALLLVSIFLLILPVLYVHMNGVDAILEEIEKTAVLKQLYEKNIMISLWNLIIK